jgi:hypothetical protein
VSFTPRPPYPLEATVVLIEWEAVWVSDFRWNVRMSLIDNYVVSILKHHPACVSAPVVRYISSVVNSVRVGAASRPPHVVRQVCSSSSSFECWPAVAQSAV